VVARVARAAGVVAVIVVVTCPWISSIVLLPAAAVVVATVRRVARVRATRVASLEEKEDIRLKVQRVVRTIVCPRVERVAVVTTTITTITTVASREVDHRKEASLGDVAKAEEDAQAAAPIPPVAHPMDMVITMAMMGMADTADTKALFPPAPALATVGPRQARAAAVTVANLEVPGVASPEAVASPEEEDAQAVAAPTVLMVTVTTTDTTPPPTDTDTDTTPTLTPALVTIAGPREASLAPREENLGIQEEDYPRAERAEVAASQEEEDAPAAALALSQVMETVTSMDIRIITSITMVRCASLRTTRN